MFCKLVGDAVLFGDGWLFPTNVKDGKTQECIRLYRGHIPFDEHVAVLTLPEYRAAKVPIGLDQAFFPINPSSDTAHFFTLFFVFMVVLHVVLLFLFPLAKGPQ